MDNNYYPERQLFSSKEITIKRCNELNKKIEEGKNDININN